MEKKNPIKASAEVGVKAKSKTPKTKAKDEAGGAGTNYLMVMNNLMETAKEDLRNTSETSPKFATLNKVYSVLYQTVRQLDNVL